jgi:hypothetical protein
MALYHAGPSPDGKSATPGVPKPHRQKFSLRPLDYTESAEPMSPCSANPHLATALLRHMGTGKRKFLVRSGGKRR